MLQNLSPANFAFVMSTGVLSIIFHLTGWPVLAFLFLIIGAAGYGALVVLFVCKGSGILRDFEDIPKIFQYLTFSAGSNTLAVSCALMGYNVAGLILGIVGIISNILLVYLLVCILFFHRKVSIQTLSPFWLLLAIACNSSGIVLSTLWRNGVFADPFFLLFAFCFWSFGVIIYLVFITLDIYRMFFFPVEGRDLNPCYWTLMGAAAIAAVDGSLLVLADHPPVFIIMIRGFIEGMVVLLWGWGTAWIPILCLMEIWKKFYYKVPFHYEPSRWAMVFPLGMYTAASDLLTNSVDLKFIHIMIPVWLWITFAAWCIVAYMSRFNPFAKS